MSGKKKKTNFNVKKAKEYYSGTEHSYPQDSSRLSKRGIRSEMGSQINDSFGKSTKKKDLSKIISSDESVGSEFGGPGYSSKTVSEYNKNKKK